MNIKSSNKHMLLIEIQNTKSTHSTAPYTINIINSVALSNFLKTQTHQKHKTPKSIFPHHFLFLPKLYQPFYTNKDRQQRNKCVATNLPGWCRISLYKN